MPSRPASIKVRALQWLAQREHSRVELRGKLLRLLSQGARGSGRGASLASAALTEGDGLQDQTADADIESAAEPAAEPVTDPAAEVERLLQWLELHGYLSQERFIESRVHARQSRFGNQRIRQELRQHGLSLGVDAQHELRHTEQRRAEEVWRKKYDAVASDAAGRVRQMRFLVGRGFSLDVVRRIVKSGGGIDDEPEGDIPRD